MRTRKSTLWVVFACLLWAAAWGPTVVAGAASFADTVYDGAGLFSTVEFTMVEQAAKDLAVKTGAQVHVVTMRDLGNADTLKIFFQELTDRTPAWRATDGGAEKNLLVFAVASESRDLGLFYAVPGLFSKVFADPEVETDIWMNHMGSEFKNGRWADGFIAGMKQAEKVIVRSRQQAAEPVATAPAVVVNVIVPTAEPAPVRTEPVVKNEPVQAEQKQAATSGDDGAMSLGNIAIFVVLILVMGGVLFLALKYREKKLRELKDAEDKRLLAYHEAKRLHDAVKTALRPYYVPTFMSELRERIKKYSDLAPKRREELDGMLQRFEEDFGSADDLMKTATADNVMTNDSLPIDIYDVAGKRFEDALKYAKAAGNVVADINGICRGIQDELNSIPIRVEKLQKNLERLFAATNHIRTLPIDAESQFYALDAEKARVAGFDIINPIDYSMVTAECVSDSEKSLIDIEEALGELQNAYDSVMSGIPVSRDAIEAVAGIAKEKVAVLAELEARYDPSSWNMVADNVNKAKAILDSLRAKLKQVEELAGARDVLAAKKALSAIKDPLREAGGLLDTISARLDELKAMSDSAENEFKSTAQTIQRADTFVDDCADIITIKDYRHTLTKADKMLGEAQSEAAREKPAIDRALAMAREAKQIASNVHSKATDDYELVQRKRREAEEEMKRLERKMRETDEYFAQHSRDIDESARRNLDEAKREYEKARRASDFATMLMLSQAAMRRTRGVYSSAEDMVRRAEKRRRDQRSSMSSFNTSSISSRPSSISSRPSTPSLKPPTSSSRIGGSGGSFGGGSKIGGSGGKF